MNRSRIVALIIIAAIVATFAWQIAHSQGTTLPWTPNTVTYNVQAFGGKCDGVTDDSTAWNNTINAAKNAANVAGTPMTTVVQGCTTGQSMVSSTLNFSGIISPVPTAFTVDMTGTCLLGKTNGTPVIDAMGSAYIRWVHLCIKGMPSQTPNVGIQWGRLSTGVPADQFYWDHPVVEGFFTFAAAYNQASEDNTYIAPRFTNANTTGTSYGLVMDGYAFWTTSPNNRITSAFQTLTTSVTAYSFIGETFIGGNIVSNNTNSPSSPIWMGQTSQHEYQGTYINSNSIYDVTMYCGTASSGGVNKSTLFDVHMEGASVTKSFLFTGAQAGTCFVYDFQYIDNLGFASSSIFAIDGGSSVTAVQFDNANIKIATLLNTPTVFDTAANYKFSGRAYLPTVTPWNTPAKFSGTLCYANQCDSYSNPTGTQNFGIGLNALGLPPTGNFNTAIGFSVLSGSGTAGNNTGVGYNVMTGVTSGGTNAAFGSTAGQFISTGAGNAAFGYGAMTGITGSRITGNNNTALGASSLNNLQTTGANNTAVGSAVGSATLTTGGGNILIGNSSNTDTAAAGTSNTLQIRGLSPGIATVAASGINTASPFLSLPASQNVGTKFTTSGCSVSATTGGASAGTLTLGANTCTVVITIAGATGNTATNGWTCQAHDRTAPTVLIGGESSSTTTTASITIPAGAGATDVISFSCVGY